VGAVAEAGGEAFSSSAGIQTLAQSLAQSTGIECLADALTEASFPEAFEVEWRPAIRHHRLLT
jgi:hypothetical protein